MDKPFRLFYHWIILVVTITGLVGLSFGLVQQVLRQSANDPQIQLAEDGARALAGGQDIVLPFPASAPSGGDGTPIDIATSLAPFIIVFDDSGTVLSTSGQLDGKTPVPPTGVLEYVRSHGEERLTWQPRSDVRIASVITRYIGKKSGFVLAGRSLKETEARIQKLQTLALLAWAAILGITFLLSIMPSFRKIKK